MRAVPGNRYVTVETLADRSRAWLAACRPWSRDRAVPHLGRAALAVIDLQRFFAESDSHAFLPALSAVLPNVRWLVRAFHAAGRPVVLTRQGRRGAGPSRMAAWWGDELRRGEPRAELIAAPELELADRVLDKEHYSAFFGTDLQDWLAQRRCDVLVVCGVMTHLCCEATARDAFMREVQPVVVADGCASRDEELHLGALRNLAHGYSTVTSAASVVERLGQLPRAALGGSRAVAATPVRHCDVLVAGAGPAGLAAAIQAQRNGLTVTLIDRDGGGGLARTANWVENYPGFPGGIPGAELMERFVAQARSTGLGIWRDEVAAVVRRAAGNGLQVQLRGGPSQLSARAVMIATGTAPRPLPFALGEPGVVSRLDAAGPVRGSRVLVIGGGEAAMDQALLAHREGAAEVRIAVRGAAPRAMPLLVQRVRDRGLELRTETRVEAVRRAGDAFVIRLGRRGETLEVAADHVVACIGRAAALPALPEAVGEGGSVSVDDCGRTPVPGLYLIGDVRRGARRQVGIAVGDGLLAAMDAVEYLAGGRWGRAPPAAIRGEELSSVDQGSGPRR